MTQMSMKLFKVWQVLLDHPNEWMDATELSSYTDLTSRQVVSLMAEVTSPEVKMEMTEERPHRQICYTGTDAQRDEVRRQLSIWRYHISPVHIEGVYNAMSCAGWSSITDISDEIGMSKANVSKVLRVMEPGTIESKPMGASTLYRRT